MSLRKNSSLIPALLFLVALSFFSSCSKDNKPPESKSPAEKKSQESLSSAGQKEITSEDDINYGEGRKIFRIDKQDLNGDKKPELVVLSSGAGSADDVNGPQKFDMLEIFMLDTSKAKFVKTVADTVDFAVDCKYVDMNNTGNINVFVLTNSGGNNSVASEGMFVYGFTTGDSIQLIKYFDGGAPEISEEVKGKERFIKVTELFHGVMPMALAVPYTGSIYELKNNELVLSNMNYPEYYQKKIDEVTEKYFAMKRKVEMGMQMAGMSYPLYREAAEVIVNYNAKGDFKGMRKFWEQEKESLQRNIPQDEFTDLSNYIRKVLPPDTNA